MICTSCQHEPSIRYVRPSAKVVIPIIELGVSVAKTPILYKK